MRTLLTGGIVVSMDPAVGDLARGDVLITDGVITEVAERIDAPDAEVIDATGRIVLPGFVDTPTATPGRPRSAASGRTGRSPSTASPCTARSSRTTGPRTSTWATCSAGWRPCTPA